MSPHKAIHIPSFVKFIIQRLRSHNFTAYIVGGAIRDLLIGRKALDWDITTNASDTEIKKIFSDRKYFSIKHETITLVDGDQHYEVTPFRGRDKNSLLQDLERRDFTINSIAYDPMELRFIDPFQGRSDISNKVIRAVNDPGKRFSEDPLRLLRAIRLSVDLNFKIEPDTLEAMTRLSRKIQDVALERIRDELLKILLTKKPSRAFHLMRKTGILKYILPELLEGYRKRQNAYHRYTIFRHVMETLDQVEADEVLRLAALLHDIAKPRVRTKDKYRGEWRFLGHEKQSAIMAKEILLRLKFSKEQITRVCKLIENHMIGYKSDWSDAAVRRFIKRIGVEDVFQLIKFRRADLIAHGIRTKDIILLDELESRIKKELDTESGVKNLTNLAIDGNTVMEILALSPGPKVGRILAKLEELVLEHPELNTRDSLTGVLKELKDV